jgi:hypothetical protein
MRIHAICAEVEKLKVCLKKKTGVNLDHFYRMARAKSEADEKRKLLVEEQEGMRKRAKLGMFLLNKKILILHIFFSCIKNP